MRKSAGAAGFRIGAAVIVLLPATLGGCAFAPYDVFMRERQHTEDEQACTNSGYKPGTNPFAKCVQDRELTRMRGLIDRP
jgi:hypothetical protein